MPTSASDNRRRPLRDRRGISASEFALVAGIFFVTVLVVIEVGRYFLTVSAARTVVAQAARAIMVYPTTAPMNGGQVCNTQVLIDRTGGLSFVSSTGTLCATRSTPCTSDPTPVAGRTQVQVTLTAPYRLLVTALGFTNITISETQTFCFAT